MAIRKIKTYSQFVNEAVSYGVSTKKYLSEAADWDDTRKRYIDRFFISFDDKEKDYEVKDFIQVVIGILLKEGVQFTVDELTKVVWECKDKIARNHPRRALMKCVLSHFGIDIEDIEN